MPTLSWLTRDEDLRATSATPYRLLEEVRGQGCGDKESGNMLIQGDNLEALKALLPYFAGRVKCVYIDPPYNTRSAFQHYDDNLEHTQWLAMMWPRVEILRELLSEDGSIWMSINDNEAHYLKVIGDEIFGRENFLSDIIWQKRYSSSNDAKWVSENHDHLLAFAKSKSLWSPNRLPRAEKSNTSYKNPDDDPRGLWRADNYKCNKSVEERPNLYYAITNPNTGEEIWPKKTAVWRYNEATHLRHVRENRVWWGKSGGNKVPAFKRFLKDTDKGQVPGSIWTWEEVGHNQDGNREQQKLNPDRPFSTPKPERLIQRVLEIATVKGDLVLDSFLGSGTTAAVAHKMERHYIGVEVGEHAESYCAPRLRHVIDGEQGGISEDVGWNGGGGFRFYCLGYPVFDEQGQVVSDISFSVLAAHVWFCETSRPWISPETGPFLGVWMGRAYALLYNGVLGDKKIDGGNVLTRKTLEVIRQSIGQTLKDFDGPLTVYGEQCRLGPSALKREEVTFKQTPYDVKARA